MSQKSVTIQAIKWEIQETDENVVIYIHGLDRKNKRVTVKIPDFKPYVYLELDSKVKWTEGRLELLRSYLRKSLHVNFPAKNRIVERKKNYYYKSGKFLWMAFNTTAGIRALVRAVRDGLTIYGIGRLRLVVHEQRANPILQLFAMRKIKPAGWIVAKRTKKQQLLDEHSDKFSTSDIEMVSGFSDISPAKAISQITNPLIVSYDIECISGDKTGNTFPNPNRKTDQISCISATVGYSQDDEQNWRTFALVNEVDGRICPPLDDGSEVRHFKGEKELLLGWSNFILEIDPDIIIGYNSLSFDDNYMAERANTRLCWPKFSKMGRLIEQRSKTEERRWSSAAYGDQRFNYMDIPGRLHIDMYPVIFKDFGNLMSYTLNFVSEHFLGDHKIDLPADEMIRKWHRGTKEDIKDIVTYCNKDTILPFRLMKKLNTWIGLSEMANVMMVPIFDLVTRGQQIRVFSQLYCLCFDLGVVCTDKWTDYRPSDDEKIFVGATVQNPKTGYWELVATYDFCLAGDTLISLSNSTSKRIDELYDDYNVLGYDDQGFKDYAMVGGLQEKGEKKTIRLTLQYGKTITCTPDHRLLTNKGKWTKAQELKNSEVLCGIEYPQDTSCPLEENWSLHVDDREFNLLDNRDETLAFCRLLGFILADGSIYNSIYNSKNRKCVEVYLGTLFDANSIHADLELLTDVKVKTRVIRGNNCQNSDVKGQTYCITLPTNIAKLIHQIDGIVIGERATQAMYLPKFIIDSQCPLAVVRETLGGMFGGDGTIPCLSKNVLTISFKWPTTEKYLYEMAVLFGQLEDLLSRFGLSCGQITCTKVKYTNHSIKPADYQVNPRYDYVIQISKDSCYDFMHKIGFRYCINKAYKAYIVALYYNYCNIVTTQHRTTVLVRSSVKDRTNHHISLRYKRNFSKPADFLNDLGIKDWFDPGAYIMSHDSLHLPSFKQKIINISDAGTQSVYDIQVDECHNFVANGIVAHNCSLYPTTIIAYNLCFSTYVPDDEDPPEEQYHLLEWVDHKGCIGAGTMVTADNYCMPIEQYTDPEFHTLLAWNNNQLVPRKQIRFLNQGIKECVKLIFEEGQILVCTPDHRIMTKNGEWCEARHLNVGVDYIQCGIKYAEMNLNNDIQLCNGWSIQFGDTVLKTNNKNDMYKTCVWLRLLGYILTGTIMKNRAEVWCGHELDVNRITGDIYFLCGQTVEATFNGSVYKIHIPRRISKDYLFVKSLMIGNRMKQNAVLPTFLLNSPKPIVKYFLSGLFGGDGHAPAYSKWSKSIISVGFSWSRPLLYADSLHTVMNDLSKLLRLFNIDTTIRTRSVKNNYVEAVLYISIKDIISFRDDIGFVYCAHKEVRLNIATKYHEYRSRVIAQFDQVVDTYKKLYANDNKLTRQQARDLAIQSIYTDTIPLNEHYSKPTVSMIIDAIRKPSRSGKRNLHPQHFPSALDYFKSIGAYEFICKGYGVPRSNDGYPIFLNRIVARYNVGKQQVYDLEIDKNHSFIANGIIVHNCEHDTAVRKTKIAKKDIVCKAHSYRFYKAEVKKGITPMLLEHLLYARSNTRKEQGVLTKKLKDGVIPASEIAQAKLMIDVLDKRQLGYKIAANSAYGGYGSDYSYTPFYPAAASTTAMGRRAIKNAIDFAEEYRPDTILIYGDSVTSDTPVLLKNPSGEVCIEKISQIANEQEWGEYKDFRPSFTEPVSSVIECHVAEESSLSLLAARHMFNDDKRWSKECKNPSGWMSWTSKGWSLIKKVIRHKTMKKIYRVTTHSGIVDVTQDHSLLTNTGKQVKPVDVKIGERLLHGYPYKSVRDYSIDEHRNTLLDAAKLWFEMRQNGHTMYLSKETQNNIHIYNSLEEIDDETVVTSITCLGPVDDYVYDLETECGNFQAGVGEMIVKNTDSCMLKFNNVKTLEECFDVCEDLEKAINAIFPKPMYLELEKIYSKYFLLSKKRYVGYMVDRDGNIYDVDKKGVVIKRRDNCGYLRQIYTKLIDMVMEKQPKWKMYDYLCQMIDDLLRGKVDLDLLVITKSIKESYKAKNLPHLAVANKMRDRGKYVASGTRIQYIFTVTANKNDPQYIKAEEPDFYLRNKDTVHLDYLYYFEKQLINPIDEVLQVKFRVENVLKNLLRLLKKSVITSAAEYFHPKFKVEDDDSEETDD